MFVRDEILILNVVWFSHTETGRVVLVSTYFTSPWKHEQTRTTDIICKRDLASGTTRVKKRYRYKTSVAGLLSVRRTQKLLLRCALFHGVAPRRRFIEISHIPRRARTRPESNKSDREWWTVCSRHAGTGVINIRLVTHSTEPDETRDNITQFVLAVYLYRC